MTSVLSLFSGCGGLDLGFEREGFDIKLAIDNNEFAVDTYNRNLVSVCKKVNVETEEFKNIIQDIGNIDVLIGGFPCQGFSKSGPKKKGDPRNKLFMAMVFAAERCSPKVIVAENVDGLKQNFGGKTLDLIYEEFGKIDYRMSHKIFDFACYGVPQHRRRIIFVGVRKDCDSVALPEPTHAATARNGEFSIGTDLPLFNSEKEEPQTIRDSIHDLGEQENIDLEHIYSKKYPNKYSLIMQAIGPCQKLCDVRNAESSVHSWEIPECYGKVTAEEIEILDAISNNRRHKKYGDVPNGNPLTVNNLAELTGMAPPIVESIIQNLLDKKYIKNKLWGIDLCNATFNSGIFKRPAWDSPSPTVLTNFHNPRFFLHPKYNRPFTIREVARLQTFPDDFRFCSTPLSNLEVVEAYRQIGNAVPPLFAQQLAKVIKYYLKRRGVVKSFSTDRSDSQSAA